MKLETKDSLEIRLWPQDMCSRVSSAFFQRLLPLLLLLALPAAVHAQFKYITVDGKITITGYTGPGGAVVEVATDLANPVWSPLQTLTLTGDLIRFSDPEWMLQPTRFYRLRRP